MKHLQLTIGFAALGVLVGAWASAGQPAAAAPAPERRDCFYAGSVTGFNPVGDEAVDVSVGANRHYRLELIGYCPDVDWTNRIALRTRGGSSWICRGFDADLIVPGITGTQRCAVRAVRALTREEYRASHQRRRGS